MTRIAAALALLLLFAIPASSQVAPFVWPITVGTTQVQALPTNNARKKVVFFNPNSSAKIAFCPAGPSRKDGTTLTCTVNGAGSITLDSHGSMILSGANGSGPVVAMPSAWNVIADTPGSAATVIEFE